MKESFFNFINVIISPVKFFQNLTETTDEKFVLLLFIIINPVFYLLNFNYYVFYINKVAEKFGVDTIINNSQALVSVLFAFVTSLLEVLIISGLVFIVIKLLLGDISFKISWKISVFSMAPFVIEKILTVVISMIKKTMYLQESPFSLLAYIKEDNYFGNAILKCVNLFNIIFFSFLVIGLKKQKYEVGKIIVVCITIGILFFLYICINEFAKEGLA